MDQHPGNDSRVRIMEWPTSDDIVFDRRGRHAEHPGNLHLQSVIQEAIEIYRANETRVEKRDLVTRIYLSLRASNRRFLQEAPSGLMFFDVEEETVKTRIQHAFRYHKETTRGNVQNQNNIIGELNNHNNDNPENEQHIWRDAPIMFSDMDLENLLDNS